MGRIALRRRSSLKAASRSAAVVSEMTTPSVSSVRQSATDAERRSAASSCRSSRSVTPAPGNRMRSPITHSPSMRSLSPVFLRGFLHARWPIAIVAARTKASCVAFRRGCARCLPVARSRAFPALITASDSAAATPCLAPGATASSGRPCPRSGRQRRSPTASASPSCERAIPSSMGEVRAPPQPSKPSFSPPVLLAGRP